MKPKFGRGIEPFDVVASRIIECSCQNGRRTTITVHIGRPTVDGESGTYSCALYISKPKPKITVLYGEDSLFALCAALEIAGIKVFTTLKTMNARAINCGEQPDNGFPIRRDILNRLLAVNSPVDGNSAQVGSVISHIDQIIDR